MGGTNAYICDRCPLVVELGGHTSWDEKTSQSDQIQVVCASCGTMHRLTERHGTCQVTALPGPVRSQRVVTIRTDLGDEFETSESASEADWQPVGQHSGGIETRSQLPCSRCGQIGRMVTLAELLYPGGYAVGASVRHDCPICGVQMRLLAIMDTI